MQAFPHAEEQKNVPGFTGFFFANAATIGALSILNNVASAAPSMGGAVFYEGYSTENKLAVEVKPVTTEEGIHYELSIKGHMPKLKSDTLALFEEMIHKYFNVIVRTKNGKYIYCGAPAAGGLNFTYTPTQAGYDFEFSGAQSFAPPFYTGTIPQ